MTSRQQRLDALNVAIARAGGIIAFSRDLGVTHQAVTSWRKHCRVPVQRAVAVEKLYGVDRRFLIDPAILEALAPAARED